MLALMYCPECRRIFPDGVFRCQSCDVDLVGTRPGGSHELLPVFETADVLQLGLVRSLLLSSGFPIVVKGEAKGVKQQGGLLDFVTREIDVECLPTDIPENITVDVSELMLHESIRVRDLPVDPKWKAVSEGDTMVVHIVMPRAEEEAPAAAAEAGAVAAAPAEPEVIKKGKADEKEAEEKKK